MGRVGRHARRFTPAHAGTASCPPQAAAGGTVHPRARGDGGTRASPSATTAGSPPRTRGRLDRVRRRGSGRRFTPAHAGTAPSPAKASPGWAVHPRARGDGAQSGGGGGASDGSPPRTRGRRAGRRDRAIRARFTPAHAGTATAWAGAAATRTVHPRARGDGAFNRDHPSEAPGSPPRTRGRQPSKHRHKGAPRFTPAHAGTAPCVRLGGAGRTVHPRARGDGFAYRVGW